MNCRLCIFTIRSSNFLKFVDYPDFWLSSGIFALVKWTSDHCKGAMEIDSTGIIAFDGAKCDMEL